MVRIYRKLQRVWLVCICLFCAAAARGDVTCSLNLAGVDSEIASTISNSMVEAVALYNTYGSFNKSLTAVYNEWVPTAQAGYGGYIEFGGSRNTRVALHEMGHTMGVGTTTAYINMMDGVWGGAYANALALEMESGYAEGLHGDDVHIWPWGLNYDSENTSLLERIKHVRIMAAIRCDIGVMAYNREAENELVHPGETALFRVESPVATSYRWYKNGVVLSNGGDVSGATGPTLRIANADSTDAGEYYCAATGAGETLKSRERQLFVEPAQELVLLDLEGDVSDRSGANSGTAYGSPVYTTGKSGQAINLDGSDDYIILPETAARAKDITVATWVNWDGGSNWQRIFDFGTGTYQYMFLTPKSGSGTMRLSFLDAINGVSGQQQIDAPALSVGQWVHLAAVLKDGYATLYVNGEAAGSAAVPVTDPVDFLPTQNYIGKSQYADPLFNGRVDDFRVYNYALSGAEIWDLWGGSANSAPVFTTNCVSLANAVALEPYSGSISLDCVDDADGDSLSFEKVVGPDWLSVALDGGLSGTPEYGNQGTNVVQVRVVDPSGAGSETEFRIFVEPPAYDFESGSVAYWDFADEGAVAGGYIPGNGDRADLDGDGAMDSDDFRIGSTDLSGNGNHLTAWTSSWMKWSSESSDGDFSMVAGNSYPAAGTDSEYNPYITGIDVELITPRAWTVEARFRPAAVSGNQTIVGRDGAYAGTWGNYAALYLSTRGSDLAIEYVDAAGNHHNLQVAAGVAVGAWYQVAATSDGETLRLWLDGEEIGSLDVSDSADSALALGYGTWSVSRGMFDGGHVDRFTGYVDAVAISGVALASSEFVLNAVPAPAAPDGLIAESGDSRVELVWNPVTNADHYSVKVRAQSGGPYTAIGSTETTGFIHTSLPNGTSFYYVVSALNAGGEGPDSAEVHAVPSIAVSAGEFVIAGYELALETNFALTVSNSVPGHLYQVLETESLTAPDWQPVGTAVAGDGVMLEFDLPVDASSSNRYFKMDVQRQ